VFLQGHRSPFLCIPNEEQNLVSLESGCDRPQIS
jgi:hypothetical protein